MDHVFLIRVVADRPLRFPLKLPNAETRSAMAEADDAKPFRGD